MPNAILNTFSVNKISSDYSQKSRNYQTENSFDGFLKKSNQSDKMMADTGANQSANRSVQEKNQKKSVDYSKPLDNKTSDNRDVKLSGKENSTIDKTEGKPEKNNVLLEKKAKDFLDEVKNALNLTEQEMNSWLASLGMVAVDLFDNANLQNFFMQVKGIDVSDLLTESNTASQLKDLLAILNDLKPNLEEVLSKVSDKDNFSQLINALSDSSQEQEKLGNQVILSNIPQEESPIEASNLLNQKSKDFSEESGQESKNQVSKQEVTNSEILPEVFSKVVTTRQEVVITSDGLEQVTTTVSAKDIFEQVVTKFVAENVNGTGKITVQLNPEHLGKLAFQVVNREGQMTGQFVAESEAVKAALESQMAQLKIHLENQGIKVTDVKVVVGDTVNYFADDKPKEQSQEHEPKKRRTSISFEDLSISEVEEEAVNKQQVVEGSVDFTA